MLNDLFLINNMIEKSICISLIGISSLICRPVFSQAYPPMIFFQPLAYPNYPQRNENGDLIDSLESNTNFDNLVVEIETAGITATLRQEHFTLLAPNDEAFNALPDYFFDKFSKPENRIKVLQYHLIPGEVSEEDLNRGRIRSLSGYEIVIGNDNDKLTLNDAQAVFPPTTATNGVIIEIDRVLLPPDF